MENRRRTTLARTDRVQNTKCPVRAAYSCTMKRKALALRHVPHESLGTLQFYLESAGLECEYLDAFQTSAPHFKPADWAALIVLGGPMNVDQTDRFPFLSWEVDWIRQTVDARLPLLGICLGAQLLA